MDFIQEAISRKIRISDVAQVSNSTVAIHFKLGMLVSQPGSVKTRRRFFKPLYSHRVFEREIIRGFEQLRIQILVLPCSLQTHIRWNYKSVNQLDKFPIDNFMEKLCAYISIDFHDNITDFNALLSEEHVYQPVGDCVQTLTLNCSHGTHNFVVFLCKIEDESFYSLYERLEGFAVFFSRPKKTLNIDDQSFAYTIYRKVERNGRTYYYVAGYASVNKMQHNDEYLHGIYQIFVFPTYKQLHLNKYLLKAIHYYLQDDLYVNSVYVESQSLEPLLDLVDAERALQLTCCSRDYVRTDKETREQILQLSLNISKFRVQRIYEIIRYYWILASSKDSVVKFQEDVFKRLRRENFSQLPKLALSKKFGKLMAEYNFTIFQILSTRGRKDILRTQLSSSEFEAFERNVFVDETETDFSENSDDPVCSAPSELKATEIKEEPESDCEESEIISAVDPLSIEDKGSTDETLKTTAKVPECIRIEAFESVQTKLCEITSEDGTRPGLTVDGKSGDTLSLPPMDSNVNSLYLAHMKIKEYSDSTSWELEEALPELDSIQNPYKVTPRELHILPDTGQRTEHNIPGEYLDEHKIEFEAIDFNFRTSNFKPLTCSLLTKDGKLFTPEEFAQLQYEFVSNNPKNRPTPTHTYQIIYESNSDSTPIIEHPELTKMRKKLMESFHKNLSQLLSTVKIDDGLTLPAYFEKLVPLLSEDMAQELIKMFISSAQMVEQVEKQPIVPEPKQHEPSTSELSKTDLKMSQGRRRKSKPKKCSFYQNI